MEGKEREGKFLSMAFYLVASLWMDGWLGFRACMHFYVMGWCNERAGHDEAKEDKRWMIAVQKAKDSGRYEGSASNGSSNYVDIQLTTTPTTTTTPSSSRLLGWVHSRRSPTYKLPKIHTYPQFINGRPSQAKPAKRPRYAMQVRAKI